MSDLAPFVAATLRDKTVVDLLEENKKLQHYREIAETWTVQITSRSYTGLDSQGGERIVYATGKLNLRELTVALRDEGNPTYGVTVMMDNVEGIEPCRISTFLQSFISVRTDRAERKDSYEGLLNETRIGNSNAEIGNGIRAHEGRFEIGWHFYGDHTPLITGLQLDAEIPHDRLHLVTPDLANGLAENQNVALPLAEEVTNDGPILFRDVTLSPQQLAFFL